MGVPKFFRWMSERYPAISQLIAENRIPEFDALYLDMNGIIHNCTHSDSDKADFRMTEDKMFIAIFNYIEHLFGKIKPKQLFFMAIDGVAPRAKMNQQRARRFRTALDNEKAREKAIKEGVEMPKEPPFDSNCITPGTEFMAKLTRQLKYFISKKVSEDRDWQGVEIVLSGHEVPGEGEHKVMEYIRLNKQQPGYDPNMRHCLYGLDADLIMLGLLSHDPHFCLLREEVTFGRQSTKKSKELEHQNFYLMHLCIVREYLELEFKELKDPSVLPFQFDMERVIDDFILMAFFVGNDFLPNLPNLHINEGALALMFKIYKEVLPKAGGYINDRGVINMQRLNVLLDSLQDVEYRFFESENQDASWFKGKQLQKVDVMDKNKGRKKGEILQLTMTTPQKLLYEDVKKYVSQKQDSGQAQPFDLASTLVARDRKFVTDLADALHLQWKTVDDGDGERHLQLLPPPRLDDESSDEEEASLALQRVLKRYNSAKIVDETVEDAKASQEKKYEERFDAWKDKYYKEKYDWGLDNEIELRNLAENYVQGLQWVLFYYYRGVASWPWFYKYHYSPMISDVKRGLNVSIDFTLGQPFKPYEQLMGVLPDRSKSIVPQAYWPLMTDPASPIIDFYPRDFDLDMNGKKQDWEAVVKIPFIDETRLLPAMRTREHLLVPDEAERNDFGVSLKFTYSPDMDYTYMSSLPGIFPDLPNCHCVENIFDLPTARGLESPFGLVEGVQLGASALAGFPSLHTIPHSGDLDFASVSVFQQESRNESMVITLLTPEEQYKVAHAKSQLGQRTFVGYPFLNEAKVVRVSDELFDYVLSEDGSGVPQQLPHGPREIEDWKRKAVRIEGTYARRLGMTTGQVKALVHVELLKGLKKMDDGATVKEYGVIPGIETDYAAQMVVSNVVSEDQRFIEKAALPIEEEFPIGARAFCLGSYGFGRPLEIVSHNNNKADIFMMMPKFQDSSFYIQQIIQQAEQNTRYHPSYSVARQLNLNPLVLSKLTSSFSVNLGGVRLNLGLNLKFEAKKLKVLGYSRRSDNGWEFSSKAIQLIQQYMMNFPQFIASVQANPKGDIYNAEDMFGDSAITKIKEIQNWLKTIESKSFEKVPLDADQLDSDVIASIQTCIDSSPEYCTPPELQHNLWTRKKVNALPRHALLKPEDSEHRLGNQKFATGHRVIYVQDSGRVPIASKGTVVGLTRTPRATLLDILFDVTFMSGTTLNDRCQPFRGSTVPSTSVLNLTWKQLEVGSQAAQARQQQANATNGTSYGVPGLAGGQLVQAAAPPPLRGSFRGALAGQQAQRVQPTPVTGFSPAIHTNGHGRGGGRGGAQPAVNGRGASRGGARGGRGGAPAASQNRQGYGPIDNGAHDPSVLERNPNFRPKSYNQAPPPPALDATSGNSRARGRRGQGRGGRGRGRGGQDQGQAQTQAAASAQ